MKTVKFALKIPSVGVNFYFDILYNVYGRIEQCPESRLFNRKGPHKFRCSLILKSRVSLRSAK